MTDKPIPEIDAKTKRIMARIQEVSDEQYDLECTLNDCEDAFEGALIKQIKKDIHCLELEKKKLMKEMLTPPEDLIKGK